MTNHRGNRQRSIRLQGYDYWEHIIRDDDELNRIRQYIMDNPARWEMDREKPEAIKRTAMIKKNFEGIAV